MPSLPHEGPLDLLREQPERVPALLREALGLDLPRFATAIATDTAFPQLKPASFHVDLAVTLYGPGPTHPPLLSILLELQLRRDRRKRRSWPLYTAARHAQLGCQTCLVVIAPKPSVARWAATPIPTLQPGSPFTPLVIGPDQIPRVSRARARREPALAVMSAIAHGNSPGGVEIALAAAEAVDHLPARRGTVLFDLILECLNPTAGRALETAMQHSEYKFKSEFARRYIGIGQERGHKEGRKEAQLETTQALLLQLARSRFGLAGPQVRRTIEACADLDRLTALFSQISAAPDRATAERQIAALARKSARPPRPRAAPHGV